MSFIVDSSNVIMYVVAAVLEGLVQLKEKKNLESRLTPKQQKRQQESELIDEYHKMVTEQALETLYQSFLEWKSGTLPYFELTELIHLFHKKNQEIYKDFTYTDRKELILLTEQHKR